MTRVSLLLPLLVFLLLGLAGCRCPTPATPAAPSRRPLRTVVVISLDGFRHDYAERAGASAAPTFARIEREGARAKRLIPPFPSQTFASHATLATGVRPAKHGILNNSFRDRRRGRYRQEDDVSWYDAPPLWIHAQRLGLRSHVYHWPSSSGAWHGTEPAFWRLFNRHVRDDEKVGAIIDWLRRPAATRPALIMSYFFGCDREGHDHGPDSPEVARCVRETDKRVARLVSAVSAAHAALVIVSDHGMTKTLGEINAQRALDAAGIRGEVLSAGPIGHVYLDARADLERARVALAKLPHLAVRLPDALPRYQHPTRSGDLVLVAEAGYRLQPKLAGLSGGPTAGGHHGHDPNHPHMPGVFYLFGDGVARGAKIASARAIDVVPTVCKLLGIAPPTGAEGKVIEAALR
ncbi:MAG: alkaline phosphatase family protein [Myxococcales bacterium]|nr:alkaline phosphatase family protein [Myxococcales bacterium]